MGILMLGALPDTTIIPVHNCRKGHTMMMNVKRVVQGVLCIAAIVHIWLFDPGLPNNVSTTGDVARMVFCSTYALKRFMCIPLTYAFSVVLVHFVWQPWKTSLKAESGEQEN